MRGGCSTLRRWPEVLGAVENCRATEPHDVLDGPADAVEVN